MRLNRILALCVLMTLASLMGVNAKGKCGKARKSKPIPVIIGADFGSSTDDLFALMMANHFIDEGKIDLKGVVSNRMGDKNAVVVDIFNTFYGHPNIPIGLERNGVENPYVFTPYNGICDLKTEDGKPMFERTYPDVSKLPDGYKLYRKLLSEAKDHSMVLVEIGFSTTLCQLLQSDADEFSPLGGRDLVGKKVKAIYIQCGRFQPTDSVCGYNMKAAPTASAVFFETLPTNVELHLSPSMVGAGINYLPQDVLDDLAYTTKNPIKAVYENYECTEGQRMWDSNCLVEAVEGENSYNISPRGWVKFVDKGENSLMFFINDPNGNARHQIKGDSYFNAEKLLQIRRYNRKR